MKPIQRTADENRYFNMYDKLWRDRNPLVVRHYESLGTSGSSLRHFLGKLIAEGAQPDAVAHILHALVIERLEE